VNAPYQYIVVKDSNQRGVLACQAAHAAAESILLPHAVDYDPGEIQVCVLVAKSSDELEALGEALIAARIPRVVIHEPDPPYNGVATAVGIAPTRDRDPIRQLVGGFKVLR
jgi:hypothetical protein